MRTSNVGVVPQRLKMGYLKDL